MNNRFQNVPDGRHRSDYPPEMSVIVQPFGKPEEGYKGRHYDVIIYIQFPHDDVRQGRTPSLKYGRANLRYKEGEPFRLDMLGPEAAQSRSMAVAEVWNDLGRKLVIGHFMGEYTDDLVEVLLPLIEDGITSPAPFGEYTIRFRDAVDYYRWFFGLCRQIAEADGTDFDPAGKLQEWRDHWTKTTGETDVPGQRSWYAENGPVGGETQQQYDADVAAFEALIIENLDALDRFEQELRAHAR